MVMHCCREPCAPQKQAENGWRIYSLPLTPPRRSGVVRYSVRTFWPIAVLSVDEFVLRCITSYRFWTGPFEQSTFGFLLESKLKLGPVCQDLGKSWTRSQRRNRKAGYEHSIRFVRVNVYFWSDVYCRSSSRQWSSRRLCQLGLVRVCVIDWFDCHCVILCLYVKCVVPAKTNVFLRPGADDEDTRLRLERAQAALACFRGQSFKIKSEVKRELGAGGVCRDRCWYDFIAACYRMDLLGCLCTRTCPVYILMAFCKGTPWRLHQPMKEFDRVI